MKVGGMNLDKWWIKNICMLIWVNGIYCDWVIHIFPYSTHSLTLRINHIFTNPSSISPLFLYPPMTGNENLAPRDAKVISLIIRSLGIEECEPKVITQLLELSYKYTTEVLMDAQRYSEHCERSTIGVNDVKLALQSKVGKYFVPPPPRQYLSEIANTVNSKPLSVTDGENLVRVPSRSRININYDYEVLEKGGDKKRKMY